MKRTDLLRALAWRALLLSLLNAICAVDGLLHGRPTWIVLVYCVATPFWFGIAVYEVLFARRLDQ